MFYLIFYKIKTEELWKEVALNINVMSVNTDY